MNKTAEKGLWLITFFDQTHLKIIYFLQAKRLSYYFWSMDRLISLHFQFYFWKLFLPNFKYCIAVLVYLQFMLISFQVKSIFNLNFHFSEDYQYFDDDLSWYLLSDLIHCDLNNWSVWVIFSGTGGFWTDCLLFRVGADI